ncbi:serine protease inhibitor 88Ea-like [Palaemon carinicauda]|uniref:serine protease inhibitor 88Ea-like n=1 Tax=Palaemon carinicauda TaxID=392227 RepID=UPI0035B5928A
MRLRVSLPPSILALITALAGLCLTTADAQCLSPKDDLSTIPKYHDITGMINFDINLFRDIYSHSDKHANVFISPYSIWSSLLLAYLGSAGNTRAQMEAVLGITDKIATLKTWRVLELMYKKRDVRLFAFANRAFIDDQIVLRPCVANLLQNELEIVDFSETFEASKKINNYIHEKTYGVLSNVVQPSTLHRAVSLLVNAAIFKGKWHMQFSPKDTRMVQFYDSPEYSAFIPMMSLRETLRYGKSLELQAEILELPYSDGHTSMYLLLPALDMSPDLGLASLIFRLRSQSLQASLKNIWHRQVNVTLPRIKFRNTIGNGLRDSLVRLGMKDLFTNLADLRVLAPSSGLTVSNSIHEASIEVDEEGTVASATTVFVVTSKTNPPPPVVFTCNRPFLFLICDKHSNNILFMGAYRNATHDLMVL